MEYRCGYDLASDLVRQRRLECIEPGKDPLLKALMRSVLIVVGQVSLHQVMQLLLVYDQEKI